MEVRSRRSTSDWSTSGRDLKPLADKNGNALDVMPGPTSAPCTPT